MAEDLDPGTASDELRAAVGAAVAGIVMLVASVLVVICTDLSVPSGAVIGGSFFVLFGVRAVRLLRKRRRDRP